jgi:hypothetical protein
MTESTVNEQTLHCWYARPVLFVSDVQGAWGYDVIPIADPDGNELLFPLPSK